VEAKKFLNRKILLLTALGLALVSFATAYYFYSEIYPSTEDAYLNGNVINMATQVDGVVDQVDVQNYQKVHQGQKLFSLDPRPYEYAKEQAAATLSLDQAKVLSSVEAINVAQANWEKAKADLFVATATNARIQTLVKENQASAQQGDQTLGGELSAKAAVLSAAESLEEAKRNLDVAKHQLDVASAALKTATLNLSYTQVFSPVDGYLVQFTLRPGTVVEALQSQFMLIDNQHFWVEVNYKETQLSRIRVGQTAEIRMDMYPGVTFQGKVIDLSGSSGANFSLLPPENATGNWVKVVQRYPVKVSLEETPEQIKKYPLRIGASAWVQINTRS